MLVNVRLALVGALGVGAVTGALFAAAPAATADPAPHYRAADRAAMTAGVQAATSAYSVHPPGRQRLLRPASPANPLTKCRPT